MSSIETPLYEYTALIYPPGKPIRILILEPGSFSDPVVGSISHVDLQTTTFEALSYTWGDVPQEHEKIHIRRYSREPGADLVDTDDMRQPQDFHHFLVRPNLHEALRHLRLVDVPRILWVDALCVSQSSIEERNREVPRMGEIYNKARQVIVWLGPEDEKTNIALETIKILSAGVILNWHRRNFSTHFGSEAETVRMTPQQSTVSQAQWAALKDFFNRPWFQRLWIRQEVGLASRITVQCGKLRAEWKDLEKTALLLEHSDVRTYISRKDILFVRSLFHYHGSDKLNYILHRSSLCGYSDPRDIIYANLALSSAIKALHIKPNYQSPIAAIYKDLVYKTIAHCGNLEILRCCDLENATEGYESFVPDFSRKRSESRLLESTYYANGGTRQYPLQIDDQTTLRLKGKFVATIDYVSNSIKPVAGDCADRDKKEEVLRTLHRWEPKDLLTGEYITGGTLLDAYILLAAGGQCPGVYDSPTRATMAQCRDDFLAAAWSGGDVELLGSPKHPHYLREVMSDRRGEVFFQTVEGHMGTSPGGVQPGDIITALVGGTNPYVLRPTGGISSYQIVGPCYVQGIMFGEALFGQLPAEWACMLHEKSWRMCFRHRKSGKMTFEDPRLWPLPAPWQSHYCDFLSKGQSCINECGTGHEGAELRECHFINTETQQKIVDDPRLDLPGLEKGGIELQTYILV